MQWHLPASWRRDSLFALFLLIVTFIAYQPVWHAGFVWSDENMEIAPYDLHSLHGLYQIWFCNQSGQYYPLTYSMFWLESQFWGQNAMGYHLVNIFFHALVAILLWLVLRRLSVPGAWLAGAIFALHPVNVESVAWIIERKNTLSGVFYLCAIMAALKFWLPEETATPGSSPPARLKEWKFYWLTFALFLCALCSKTTTIPFPAVILLLVWWKRGKIVWGDVYPLFLFLAAGMGMGLITHYAEHRLGAEGKEYAFTLVERCLLAARNLWFYLGKLFWPYPLIYVYPRWKIDPSSIVAWLPLLAIVAVSIILWRKRNSWGRPIFVALAYFAGLLFLTLGFFNVYYFRYSLVSDHFQYLACMGPLALVCAGLAVAFRRLGKVQLILAPLLSICLLAVLGALTWSQCYAYANEETLWRATLARNPDAYVARNNLGDILVGRGDVDEAIEQYEKSLPIHPDEQLCHNLGTALLQKGRAGEALAVFQMGLKIQPDSAGAYTDLGAYFLTAGRTDMSIAYLQKAVKMAPHYAMASYNLGNAYYQKGDLDLAIQSWQNATASDPNLAQAHNNLGNALSLKGQTAGAVQHWRSALATQPDLIPAQVNLAWVLATSPQASLRNGDEAVRLAQRANQLTGDENPLILRTLAAAYAENEDFPDAIATAQRGLQIANFQHSAPLISAFQRQMKFYQNNQPYRDTPAPPH